MMRDVISPAAVLFDCDGVLVDSEPIGHLLLKEDLAAVGFHVTLEEIHRDFVGGTMEVVGERARAMGAALPGDWVQDHYRRLYARLAAGTPLMPGVEAVLDALDVAGIPYAVGSNGTTTKMTTTLGQHPGVWARLKDHLYSGQELGCPKPDPGLFWHAADALGVAREACVVVDDSATGCRAGIAAGMRTLGFAHAGNGASLAATGAEVFDAMEALPGLIGL